MAPRAGRWGLRAAGAWGLAVACVAVACKAFEADAESTEPPSEGGTPMADAGTETGTDSGDASQEAATCNRIAPAIVESFDDSDIDLSPHEESGDVEVRSGAVTLTATKTGAQAYVGKAFVLPTGVVFQRARLEFVFKALAPPPTGYFVVAGCAIDFRQWEQTRSQVRLELRKESMTLDDFQLVDGGVADTGVGPELGVFSSVAKDYPIRLAVEAEGATLRSTGSIDGRPSVSKSTPSAGQPRSIEVHCGIDNISIPPDGGAYSVTLDDIRVELCGL